MFHSVCWNRWMIIGDPSTECASAPSGTLRSSPVTTERFSTVYKRLSWCRLLAKTTSFLTLLNVLYLLWRFHFQTVALSKERMEEMRKEFICEIKYTVKALDLWPNIVRLAKLVLCYSWEYYKLAEPGTILLIYYKQGSLFLDVFDVFHSIYSSWSLRLFRLDVKKANQAFSKFLMACLIARLTT